MMDAIPYSTETVFIRHTMSRAHCRGHSDDIRHSPFAHFHAGTVGSSSTSTREAIASRHITHTRSRRCGRQIKRRVFQHVRVFQNVGADLHHARFPVEVLVRHKDGRERHQQHLVLLRVVRDARDLGRLPAALRDRKHSCVLRLTPPHLVLLVH